MRRMVFGAAVALLIGCSETAAPAAGNVVLGGSGSLTGLVLGFPTPGPDSTSDPVPQTKVTLFLMYPTTPPPDSNPVLTTPGQIHFRPVSLLDSVIPPPPPPPPPPPTFCGADTTARAINVADGQGRYRFPSLVEGVYAFRLEPPAGSGFTEVTGCYLFVGNGTVSDLYVPRAP
jgi:hypothetical protein